MQMHYSNGFNEHPRQERFMLYSVVMGLLGVVIGAILVYGLFIYHLLPEEGESSTDPGEQSVLPSPPPVGDQVVVCASEVVEKVMPAVVRVKSTTLVHYWGQAYEEPSEGSGVVIRADGYIVTNYHVVEGEEPQISVVFPDGSVYDAELVGIDPHTDLALLKIDQEQLTYVPLGNSSAVRVGEPVFAIGNPLDFQQTVTAGIISGTERQVMIPRTPYYYTFLQTDAGINPGNSGGPLINLRGEVVGINSLKFTGVDVEAIGFAVPSNTVRRVAGDLIEYGEIRRPMLGIEHDLREASNTGHGVRIVNIVPGGSAEAGGLEAGDVIVGLGEIEIDYLAQLYATLWVDYYPGDEVVVTVLRGEQEITTTVVLN